MAITTAPWEELEGAVRGKLTLLAGQDFLEHFRLFNAASRPKTDNESPLAIFHPNDAQDVSEATKFALKHGLTLSVKSGGYNPSKWSSSGQLVIDLCNLRQISIQGVDDETDESPQPHGRRTTRTTNGKGKRRRDSPSPADHEDPSVFTGSAAGSSKSRDSASTTSASTANGQEGATAAAAAAALSSVNAADAQPSLSTKSAGKRRMLEHSSQHQSNGRSSVSNGDVNVMADPEQEDEEHGEERENDGQQTANPELARFVVANTYPPMNLANADPAKTKDLSDQAKEKLESLMEQQQNGHRHYTRQSLQSTAMPFNYDAIKHEATFAQNYSQPPGSIPFPAINPTSSSASSSSATPPNAHSQPERHQLIPQGTNDTGRIHMHHNLPHGADAAPSNPSSSSSSYSSSFPSGAPGASHHSSRQSSGTPSGSSVGDGLPFGVPDPTSYKVVTFGSGTKAKQLDEYTSRHGYFVPLACYPVGSAIFSTGGFGFVSRLFGLSMDLTVELEVVLPKDGRILTLRSDYAEDDRMSEEEKTEQEELWWAFRGAGTAFGIVTKIKAKAFQIGRVLAGNIIYPFNPITAPSLLKHWRDCLKNAPRELYTNLTLAAGPSFAGHAVIIQFLWCGKTRSEGEMLLQAILSWEGETCILKDVEERPYADQQENASQILSSKVDTRWLVRSTLVHSLSDESIHQSTERFKSVPPGTSWLFELAGGAIAEPNHPTCFPLQHRRAPFQMAALHQWVGEADDTINQTAAEDWVYRVLGKESCGPFPCFLASGEGRERMVAVYGKKNWERLRALKVKYDAKGLLRYTHFEDELLKDTA